ncbi:MAG: DUF2071 domain-containing protein [Ignavibacteria bacterium]
MKKVFLKAEWRKLIIVNYKIDKGVLKEHLPYKTEFDLWNNICYISLVGFMFLNTKVKGIRIPFHVNFEEVNLRFYVKHRDEITGAWKRGVVFFREIVPKRAIVLIANTIYQEKYNYMKMNHKCGISDDSLKISYAFKDHIWNSFNVTADIKDSPIKAGSEEEFITEHYWGYTKVNESKTSEYEVRHPRWNVYKVKSYNIHVDFERSYGKEFGYLNFEKPFSVFLAEGSEIKVMKGSDVKR